MIINIMKLFQKKTKERNIFRFTLAKNQNLSLVLAPPVATTLYSTRSVG